MTSFVASAAAAALATTAAAFAPVTVAERPWLRSYACSRAIASGSYGSPDAYPGHSSPGARVAATGAALLAASAEPASPCAWARTAPAALRGVDAFEYEAERLIWRASMACLIKAIGRASMAFSSWAECLSSIRLVDDCLSFLSSAARRAHSLSRIWRTSSLATRWSRRRCSFSLSSAAFTSASASARASAAVIRRRPDGDVGSAFACDAHPFARPGVPSPSMRYVEAPPAALSAELSEWRRRSRPVSTLGAACCLRFSSSPECMRQESRMLTRSSSSRSRCASLYASHTSLAALSRSCCSPLGGGGGGGGGGGSGGDVGFAPVFHGGRRSCVCGVCGACGGAGAGASEPEDVSPDSARRRNSATDAPEASGGAGGAVWSSALD